MKTPEKFYEELRKKGLLESITANPNPDYSLLFYQKIFELMQAYSDHVQEQRAMTKEECKEWVGLYIPFAVKPKRKIKYDLVGVFTSQHAHEVVINHLADELYLLQVQEQRTVDVSGKRHIDVFTEQLDKIFEQSSCPTKAVLYGAFHKAVPNSLDLIQTK